MKNEQNPLWRNGQIPSSESQKPGTDQSPEAQARKSNDSSAKKKKSK